MRADDDADRERHRERHRERQPGRLEREPAAGAAGAEDQRHRHRGERHHRFDRQVHVAGDQRQRQADGDDADEGRLLEDVEEDADLEEVRDGQREDRQHDDQDEPDEVVEHELDRRPPARARRWRSVERVLRRPSAGHASRALGARARARRRWPAPACRIGVRAYSTGLTGSVGGFRLPQKFGSSTLSLVIAAPGILMFGPQASIVSADSRPVTS